MMGARDKAIMELRRKASVSLQKVEDATAAGIERLINQVIDLMVAYLEGNPSASIDEMVSILSALIDYGAENGAALMVEMGDEIIDVSTTAQANALGAVRATTANEFIAAAATWTDQYRVDLLSEGHQLWYGRLKNDALHPNGVLRTALESANVWGDSMTKAAQRLVDSDPEFSAFPPLDMDPMARARMIVRTESTRFDTAVSVSLAEAAGVTLFANIGVGDTRQSDICQDATEQSPMTIDQWRGSRWGAPPRHPNCRCALVGVGAEFDPSDKAKQDAGVIK